MYSHRKKKNIQISEMHKIVIIFSLYILTRAVLSKNPLKSLSAPQSRLLDSFKPCIIRMVFLENSWSASEDVLLFLHYYQNQVTFILESIPFDSKKKYIKNSTMALSSVHCVQHMRYNYDLLLHLFFSRSVDGRFINFENKTSTY